MKNLVFLFLFVFCQSTVFAQQDPIQLNDSAMSLYKNDPQKAVLILEKALQISEKNKKEFQIAQSKNNLGIVYRDLGDFEKAKQLSSEALLTNDSILKASAYNNIGVVNRNMAKYDEALRYYLKALDIYQAKQMKSEIATTFNSIGLVYSYNGINTKAIEYHLKAKAIFETIENKKGISEVYNNIAIIYANDGDLEQALDYFKYSLKIEETLDDKKGIAESVNNVGAVFYYMNEIDSALVYFRKSLAIEKSIGDMAGISASYNNLANVLIENGRLKETKTYIDSAMYFAENSKIAVDIEVALDNYSRYYEAKNDTKTALNYYKEMVVFRDSLLNIATNEKIAELEIEYQTEKKEKEILSQRADLAEQNLSLNEKNTQLLGLGVLAAVLTLLGYLFYSQQRLKNRQLQKENELKDALVKIETQNRLQEQRLRISRDLHDNIGAQLTFIISSLDNLKYGFKIPEKLSNKLKNISEFTTTTIYELRDTIWAMNKNAITLEDLQSRISNFIDKADLATENIKFEFNSNISDIDRFKLSSLQGMNLYRIIQEAINNSIKYSKAKHITIDFNCNDQQIKVDVTDDGKGFVLEHTQLGNGINNMKKRTQEIKAELIILSKLNQGTTITITV
ncbi:tetratricopeptide repeat-containing sensor histidine kinase [Psychroserpens ponticola]|uniref:histidine kinase n=1 Tax=Psychroserpens ponticola TaxID=2932268 RepID=A0ABY7RV21_9FLAO|nr:tetratricopeptide repeat protein [Psychroserpens ponticola]WCO00970.1 sensor histidine kinase [Psychroserpens ponticola]